MTTTNYSKSFDLLIKSLPVILTFAKRAYDLIMDIIEATNSGPLSLDDITKLTHLNDKISVYANLNGISPLSVPTDSTQCVIYLRNVLLIMNAEEARQAPLAVENQIMRTADMSGLPELNSRYILAAATTDPNLDSTIQTFLIDVGEVSMFDDTAAATREVAFTSAYSGANDRTTVNCHKFWDIVFDGVLSLNIKAQFGFGDGFFSLVNQRWDADNYSSVPYMNLSWPTDANDLVQTPFVVKASILSPDSSANGYGMSNINVGSGRYGPFKCFLTPPLWEDMPLFLSPRTLGSINCSTGEISGNPPKSKMYDWYASFSVYLTMLIANAPYAWLTDFTYVVIAMTESSRITKCYKVFLADLVPTYTFHLNIKILPGETLTVKHYMINADGSDIYDPTAGNTMIKRLTINELEFIAFPNKARKMADVTIESQIAGVITEVPLANFTMLDYLGTQDRSIHDPNFSVVALWQKDVSSFGSEFNLAMGILQESLDQRGNPWVDKIRQKWNPAMSTEQFLVSLQSIGDWIYTGSIFSGIGTNAKEKIFNTVRKMVYSTKEAGSRDPLVDELSRLMLTVV